MAKVLQKATKLKLNKESRSEGVFLLSRPSSFRLTNLSNKKAAHDYSKRPDDKTIDYINERYLRRRADGVGADQRRNKRKPAMPPKLAKANVLGSGVGCADVDDVMIDNC